MPAEMPVIKFSPFEALLIGEKNKIIKRKPMKNVIFVTHLTNKKKSFDLRALFDIEDESKEDLLEHRYNNNRSAKLKSGSDSEIYCYEYEGQKMIVRSGGKFCKQKNNSQSNKIRFKPEFKFRETLEERIVHKIRKRKNVPCQVNEQNGISKPLSKQQQIRNQSVRCKNGKFIKINQHDKHKNGNKSKYLARYLKHLYAKKGQEAFKRRNGERRGKNCNIDKITNMKRQRNDIDSETSISDNGSQMHCRDHLSKDVEFPPVPTDLETSDFDNDTDLLNIICESKKRRVEEDAEKVEHRKGLKMYERKRSSLEGCDSVLLNNIMKDNCVNKYSNSVGKGRRNGLNYLIDERPTKDSHLLSGNKVTSLFYRTAYGTETYLGNTTKSVVLNSTFGRLSDIS